MLFNPQGRTERTFKKFFQFEHYELHRASNQRQALEKLAAMAYVVRLRWRDHRTTPGHTVVFDAYLQASGRFICARNCLFLYLQPDLPLPGWEDFPEFLEAWRTGTWQPDKVQAMFQMKYQKSENLSDLPLLV